MAGKKKVFDPGFVPVDLEKGGRESLAKGKCELERVESAGEQRLVLVFRPEGWGYPLMVDLGKGSPGFAKDTPWEEVLGKPVEGEFIWLGKTYKASVRLERSGVARVELVDAGEPFAGYTMRLDRTDAERMARTILGVGGKPCIGLVIGGTPMYIGNRTFGDFVKLSPVPRGRREVAAELYDSMYDALANCDEGWVDVVAYRADTGNPVTFRITDRDGHEEDLRDLRFRLVDGGIDVVNVRPRGCVETVYAVVPVDGEM